MSYLYFNGAFLSADVPFLGASSRLLRYGDGFFETFVLFEKKIPLLSLHFDRLADTAQALGMQLPDTFNQAFLLQLALQLAHLCHDTRNARFRLTISRDNGGFYVPISDQVQVLLEMQTLENEGFMLPKNGLRLGTYQQVCKLSSSPLSNLKTNNALCYILAARQAAAQGFDDVLLLNEHRHVIESTNSNLFAWYNGALYTPPLSEGCLNGVLRRRLLHIARQNGVPIYEKPLLLDDIACCQALWLTNAVQGIRWVAEWETNTYQAMDIAPWIAQLMD